jgi:hypothetical protein
LIISRIRTLSIPGVETPGVNNRTELADCLAAEARGPLPEQELQLVIELRQKDAVRALQ